MSKEQEQADKLIEQKSQLIYNCPFYYLESKEKEDCIEIVLNVSLADNQNTIDANPMIYKMKNEGPFKSSPSGHWVSNVDFHKTVRTILKSKLK
jgi:hypothetical protein